MIDTAELGVLIRIGVGEATVETEDKKLVTIRWTGGKVESWWDSGLVIETDKRNVSITSRDVRFTIEDDGMLR